MIYDQNSTNFKDILKNLKKLYIYCENSTCLVNIIEQSEQLRTSFMHLLWNSAYFYSGTKPFFPKRGDTLGIGIPREIHWYTPSERREERGKWSGAIGTSIYNPYGKRERVRYTQIIRRVARPSQGEAETPTRQAETPTRQAETLTLEGANQDIKESGHRSRRPPAHKGYNQFIKDARRSQRATQFSQLKPMEGKIWSLTQTCRNTNREWTLQIDRHP